jgi:hypothetical protein
MTRDVRDALGTAEPPSPSGSRLVRRVFVLLAALIALGSLARVADIARTNLAAPFDLHQESSLRASIGVLQQGDNPYSESVYADVPFVLTMYAPGYLLLVAALPEAVGRPYYTGRLVVLIALLAAAGLTLVVSRGRRGLLLGALACGWFFLYVPIAARVAYMRVDPPGLLLSAAAVVLAARGRWRLAALLCIGALVMKQTFVAAGAACLLQLVLTDRRRAGAFALLLAGLGLACALVAQALWGSGFWFCTLQLPANEVFPSAALSHLGGLFRHPSFVVPFVLTLVTLASAWRRDGLGLLRDSPYPGYVLVSLAVLVLTVGKAGAGSFYFLEFMLAQLLWLVHTLGAEGARGAHGVTGAHGAAVAGPDGTPRAVPSAAVVAAGLLVLVGGAAELAGLAPLGGRLADPQQFASARAYSESVRAYLARDGLDRPLLLNVGPPSAGWLVSDTVCLNDAYLYNLAFREGKLSPQPLLDAVARRAFDVVLLPTAAPASEAIDEPMGAVVQAVRTHYRLRAADTSYALYVR